jgi:hypothetical protein
VHWLPDGAPMKNKIPYAHGKESLKMYLGGLKEFVVSSRDYTTEREIIQELEKWA